METRKNYGSDYHALAHAWVYNTDKNLYCYNYGHRMFVENDILYSYGKHFPLARKYKDVVFLTNNVASVTTSKQQNIVERALYQQTYKVDKEFIEKLSVIDKDFVVDEVIRQYNQAVFLAEKWQKARSQNSKIIYENDINENISTINYLIKEFRVKSKIPKHIKNVTYEYFTGEEFKTRQLRLSKQKKAQRTRNINKWRKGKLNTIDAGIYDILRIIDKQVETSQRVKISIEEFTRLYKLLQLGRILGANIVNTSYTVLNVTDEEIKIGCHNIKRSEIEKMAKTLKI